MRVGVIACAGRMGRANLREVLAASGLTLAGGVEQPGHPALGSDLGVLAGGDPIGLAATADAAALIAASDVLIEFSTPAATLEHARLAADAKRAIVVGTTGIEDEHRRELTLLATRIPIVFAANMSIGINLLLGLVEQVASTLDEDWDVEIAEMHHRHKVDAPSGTALALGRAAARGREAKFEQVAVRSREGFTGARKPGTIGFASLRGGDVVGEHDVIFAAAGERLVLRHVATDRTIYAKGAIRAAQWVADKRPGLYGMRDVLGLA